VWFCLGQINNAKLKGGALSAPFERLVGALILEPQEEQMHYRNGREAKNGDKVVSLSGYGSSPVNINSIGILYDAVYGNDFCNGSIASIIGGPVISACLCDCLHLDDLGAILAEKGLDERPAGK
jgi:hypothetical protein